MFGKKCTEEEKARIEERELQHNGEGYPDPTAYQAIKRCEDSYPTHISNYRRDRSEEYERFYKLLGCIHRICELSGFELGDRVTLIDKQTGKIWR